MFGIGMPELILILVVGLIVIGPKKLPELAKSLGRAINEFKKATQDITDTIDITGTARPASTQPAGRITHDESTQAERPETGGPEMEQPGPGRQMTPETQPAPDHPKNMGDNPKQEQETKTETPEAGGVDG